MQSCGAYVDLCHVVVIICMEWREQVLTINATTTDIIDCYVVKASTLDALYGVERRIA